MRRSLVKKEETAVASIVQLDGRPETAVRNVSRAARVRLALGVYIVLQVLPEKGRTMMLPSANNVNWAKQPLKVLLNAILAMLEHSAKPRVSVQNAQKVFIKTTKVKITASNATEAKRSLMLKPPVVIVTKVNMAVTMALVQHARLDFIKIPKVKRSADIRVSPLEKYPTTKAPVVNCHRGVPAKWANI